MSDLMSNLLKKIVVGIPAPLPIALFLNGEQGAWYNPSDLTTLFKDAAGTDPVTADGDPVGLMLDLSPNANHASQSVTGSKPIYRTDGTLHWLEFNGTKEMKTAALAAPIYAPSSGLFASAVSSSNLDSIGGVIMEREAANDSNRVGLYADTRATPARLGVVSPTESVFLLDRGAEWDGSVQVLALAGQSGDIVNGYINGQVEDSVASPASYAASTVIDIGVQSTGSIYLEGNFYGAIARSTESSGDDISKITRYLAKKSGVTL